VLTCTLSHAQAVQSPIIGTFNGSQENQCLHVAAIAYRVDCAYTDEHKPLNTGVPWPWVGPMIGAVYYRTGSIGARPTYGAAYGDDRISLQFIGQMTIDEHGTADGRDDTIAGIFKVQEATRNVVTRLAGGAAMRAVESWREAMHTLDPTAVNSASANSLGGFDYVIGTKGIPRRICGKAIPTDCFPSSQAPLLRIPPHDEKLWAGAGDQPINRGTTLGGNVGAQTRLVFAGYHCEDNDDGQECANSLLLWGTRLNPGLDNLLLAVSTDAAGRVHHGKGFWTREFRLPRAPKRLEFPDGEPNSWSGGYLEFEFGGPAGTSLDSVESRASRDIDSTEKN
jgi:hypothetical protein